MQKIEKETYIDSFSNFLLSQTTLISKEKLDEIVDLFSIKEFFDRHLRTFEEWEKELQPFENGILQFVKEYTGKEIPSDMYMAAPSYLSDFEDFIEDREFLRCDNKYTAIYFAIKYPDMAVLPMIKYSCWPEGGIARWTINLTNRYEIAKTYKSNYFDSFEEECDVYAGRINKDNYNCHITTKG